MFVQNGYIITILSDMTRTIKPGEMMETETIDKLFLELSQVAKAKTEREIRYEKALSKISKWFGEFPETGMYWNDDQTMMSYPAVYGSNGERDFMRRVAQDDLDGMEA